MVECLVAAGTVVLEAKTLVATDRQGQAYTATVVALAGTRQGFRTQVEGVKTKNSTKESQALRHGGGWVRQQQNP